MPKTAKVNQWYCLPKHPCRCFCCRPDDQDSGFGDLPFGCFPEAIDLKMALPSPAIPALDRRVRSFSMPAMPSDCSNVVERRNKRPTYAHRRIAVLLKVTGGL